MSLYDLESPNRGEILDQMREEFPGYQSAVRGADNVQPPAEDISKQRQPATATAFMKPGDGPVTVRVSNERHSIVCEVRYDDISFLALGSGPTIVVKDLDEAILGADMETFMPVALGAK
jgi:hypothetical protein